MTSFAHKLTEVKHAAETLYASNPDWMTFYREVMGLEGIIRRVFDTVKAKEKFEKTETFGEIQRMLGELRKKTTPKESAEETRVITIRIPQSMHEALRIEALERRTTMNKLCISKLVQFVDTERVPTIFEEREARAAEEDKKSEVGQ